MQPRDKKRKLNDVSLILHKIPTGIRGFDEITNGGLPQNRPTLIVGGIGSGKTFMAMQYILKGITMYDEPGVFMTFEEKAEELLTNVSNLGYELKSMISENKLYLEHLHVSHNEYHEAGKYNIDGLFIRLEEAIDRIHAKRIVLDSLDSLFANLDISMLRSEFKRLFFWLKEKNVTAIITAEIGDVYVTRLGLEENVADCVIELSNRITNQIATRRLRIIKYRGSYHANNEYPFTIDEKGMIVFPLVSKGLDHQVSLTRISSGIRKLDEMLEGKGFFVGSSILVSGCAGTGKTSIVASFANSVCSNNETCLFCAFEESPSQVIRNMMSIGIFLDKYVKAEKLHFYYALPTLQNLELHFLSIKELIEDIKPTVIILDPVTNLMTEGPNSDIRGMLTRFIDYLKTKQVTVMFSAAITLGSVERNPSDEGISSMADTWLMVEDIELDGERNRSVYVMKSRGMAHSKEVREFIISSDGITFLPIFRNDKGILIGSKRVAAEKTNLLVTNE